MNLACWRRASLVALLLATSSCLLSPGPAWAQVSAPSASCAVEPVAAPRMEAADLPLVEVDVSAAPGRWRATLWVRYANGSSGTRSISARSCAELQRAVAVTLSLLDAAPALPEPKLANASTPSAAPPLVPERAVAGSVVATAPPSARASHLASSREAVPHEAVPQEAVPQEAAPREAVPSPPAALAAPEPPREFAGSQDGDPAAAPRAAQRPLTGFVRASSLLALAGDRFGELGAALASGAWLGAWGARVELSARRPLAKLTAAHDFTLQLERYAVGVEPCVRRTGTVELALCGGPRLELLRGLAVGPSQPRSDLVWLPGLGGGSWLRLPVTASWALSAELQASWSLRRAQASVAPWGKVYELPRLGAGLLLGAEWAL